MNIWLTFAGVFGFFAVAMGAYGEHMLFYSLPHSQFHAYETAVRYQMWHSLALLGIGMYRGSRYQHKKFMSLDVVGTAFVFGIILFSGGIYLLNMNFFTKLDFYFIPLGGLSFMIGWLAIIYYGFIGRKLNKE